MAFYRLEPFGPERDALHFRYLGWIIANVLRGKDDLIEFEEIPALQFDEELANQPAPDLVAKLQGMGLFTNKED